MDSKTRETKEAEAPVRRFDDLGEDTGWNMNRDLIAPGDERESLG